MHHLSLVHQQWPWGERRQTWWKKIKFLHNICVYAQVKTYRLYLPQSNMSSREAAAKYCLELRWPRRGTLCHPNRNAGNPSGMDSCRLSAILGIWRFLHRTVSDSCSSLGRHRLVNNTLRQSDLWGSEAQEKKRWLNCLPSKCFMAAQ